jgi:hypothetical protein
VKLEAAYKRGRKLRKKIAGNNYIWPVGHPAREDSILLRLVLDGVLHGDAALETANRIVCPAWRRMALSYLEAARS